jgi:hypothetical protein
LFRFTRIGGWWDIVHYFASHLLSQQNMAPIGN